MLYVVVDIVMGELIRYVLGRLIPLINEKSRKKTITNNKRKVEKGTMSEEFPFFRGRSTPSRGCSNGGFRPPDVY